MKKVVVTKNGKILEKVELGEGCDAYVIDEEPEPEPKIVEAKPKLHKYLVTGELTRRNAIAITLEVEAENDDEAKKIVNKHFQEDDANIQEYFDKIDDEFDFDIYKVRLNDN